MSLTNITIGTAKWLASKNNLEGVAIFAFDDEGQVKAVSYGANRAKCDELGKLLDYTINAIDKEKIKLPSFDFGCPWPAMHQGGEYDT